MNRWLLVATKLYTYTAEEEEGEGDWRWNGKREEKKNFAFMPNEIFINRENQSDCGMASWVAARADCEWKWN